MMTLINHHGDHIATCLCCEHYDSSYDEGYSKVTPGIGAYVFCHRKHFNLIGFSEQHEVIQQGRTCPDFQENQP